MLSIDVGMNAREGTTEPGLNVHNCTHAIFIFDKQRNEMVIHDDWNFERTDMIHQAYLSFNDDKKKLL